MARSRKKELPVATDQAHTEHTHTETETLPPGATDFDPAELERQSEHRAATAHIANPSSTPRHGNGHAAAVANRKAKLPGTLGITAGDLVVRLIDKGDNMAGIGIRVEVPEGRKLSDAEKAIIRSIVKGPEDQPSGFEWDRDNGMWHKDIARPKERREDIPPTRAVAIRLDAESRVKELAEALREHSADPVGYAEMVKARREQATNSERIPD